MLDQTTTLSGATMEIFVMIFVALLLGFFLHRLIFNEKCSCRDLEDTEDQNEDHVHTLKEDLDEVVHSADEDDSQESEGAQEKHLGIPTAVSLDDLFDSDREKEVDDFQDLKDFVFESETEEDDDSQDPSSFVMVPEDESEAEKDKFEENEQEDDEEKDLKVIEGIGPKIEDLLKDGGIRTWKHLSEADPDDIRTILKTGGERFAMHDPSTWPKQALFADNDQWEALKIFQDELVGGRE